LPTPGPRSVPLTRASGANGATCPAGGVGADRNVLTMVAMSFGTTWRSGSIGLDAQAEAEQDDVLLAEEAILRVHADVRHHRPGKGGEHQTRDKTPDSLQTALLFLQRRDDVATARDPRCHGCGGTTKTADPKAVPDVANAAPVTVSVETG
jgi:hypothetical protein